MTWLCERCDSAACSIGLQSCMQGVLMRVECGGGALTLTASSALANVRLRTTSADRSGPENCMRVAAASGFTSMLGASAAAGAGTRALSGASTGALRMRPGPSVRPTALVPCWAY